MNNSVLFFTQNRWAFGQIHHALTKHLWTHGIYCNLLDWTTGYSQKEHDYLKRCYHWVCTMPEAIGHLKGYGWDLNRIVAVAHCERDLVLAISNAGEAVFDQIGSFAVVNQHLAKTSEQLGIRRKPVVVRVGLDTRHFQAPVPESLKVIGYAATKTFTLSNGEECKRGHLVEAVAAETGLEFKAHEFYHHFAMPGYYRDIDAVLVSSNYETVGLPGLEAAAAGRLVLSTEVGYFDGSYGVKCRICEDEFKEDAIKNLRHYAANPHEFRMACIGYRKAVQEKYDWTKCVSDWLPLFE